LVQAASESINAERSMKVVLMGAGKEVVAWPKVGNNAVGCTGPGNF
jgi:hypothetical protein